MLSPTQADLPLCVCVCVCVCVIKGMTDSLSELNTGSKLHSNHRVNNNEKLICSTHTHTHTRWHPPAVCMQLPYGSVT